MRKLWIILSVCALFLLLSTACAKEAEPATVAEFYQQNTPLMSVNGGVGGGTDFGARLLASYWPEATGGPAMMVKIMPGGGGIEGLNFVYNSEPDGLTIGSTHHPSDVIAPKLLETPGPEFDTRTLSWIGYFGSAPAIFFVGADSPYQTLEDLQNAKGLKFAGTSPASADSLGAVIGVEILGLDADVVFGYESPESPLAAKRGEVDGYSTGAARGGDDVAKNLSKPLCSLTFERTEWFPDVPAITELVQLTSDQEDMIVFIDALSAAKSYYGPPDLPADKLDYLRRSFDKIMQMEGFLKQAKTRWKVWSKPLTGEELNQAVNRALGMPPEKAEAVRNLIKKHIK